MSFNLDETLIEQVKSWVLEAGKMAHELQREAVGHFKADHTPVTNADLQVEKFLVEKIQQAFPDHSLIAEESGRMGPDSDWLWTLDPIDGTKSYLLQLPVWAVCVGLLYQGRPAAGIIYLPVSGDLYWAWKGGLDNAGGSFWNGKQLGPQLDRAYDDSMFFLAVNSVAHRRFEIFYPRIQAFGSTAAHLAFVADGRAVGALVRKVNLWDLAAALPILRLAGYDAQYYSARPIDLRELEDGKKTSDEVIATRPEWMNRLREQIIRK